MDGIYAVKHPRYGTCYRAKLTGIGTDFAIVHFIDYGERTIVPFSNIYTCPEWVRDTPPMAILCALKMNVPDEIFYNDTSDSLTVLEAVEEERKVLEAVFCGEVDGKRLIRLLKTEEQNLVDVMEEIIRNSAYELQ